MDIMILKITVTLCLMLCLLTPFSIEAKSYKFTINSSRNVTLGGSASIGTKLVKVTATGKSADKAIEQAKIDAVAQAMFFGIGQTDGEVIPPILKNGVNAYESNKKFFKRFFDKGLFLSYVSDVNSTYPQGYNNVTSSKGRKITIYLIINWSSLEEYLRNKGLTTQLSSFDMF